MNGLVVAKIRNRLSAESIDMCSFLNCNRSFLDIAQIPKIDKTIIKALKPGVCQVDVAHDAMAEFEADWELNQAISSINMEEDEDFVVREMY